MNKNHWSGPIQSRLAMLIIGLLIIGCTPTSGQISDNIEPAAASFADEGLSTTNNSGAEQSVRATAVPTSPPSPTPLPEPVILTPTAEVEPNLAIDPLTDPDAILATINQFAAMQEAALIGQPGWIHVRRVEVVSLNQNDGEFRDVNTSMPSSLLIPPESAVSESWFHVDEMGVVYEGLGLVTDLDGRIYQHTVLFDGSWINITLKENGFTHHSMIEASDLINLPASNVANQLEEARKWSTVTLSAQINEGLYILVWESEYEEPIEIQVPSLPGLVVKDKQIFTFDAETGKLMSEAIYSYLEDGTEIQIFGTTVEAEFMTELPPDKAPLFYDTVNQLKNE